MNNIAHESIMRDGIAPLIDDIDAVLLDLWGTVHDGYRPLPGAVEAMYALKARDKAVLLLSNAPRRSAAVVERMNALGVPTDCYDGVLSSGEAAHFALRDRGDDFHGALGERVFMIGQADDDSVLAGLDYRRADSIADADFVLAIGPFDRGHTLAQYQDLLSTAAERSLPMVCANPDLEVLRGEAREICAGAMAARYRELGGEVFLHGKPHAPIYATSLELLGNPEPGRVLAVGDSLRTDVAGAVAAGMASALVLGGIHAETLGITFGQIPTTDRLNALYKAEGFVPTVAVPAFRW